MLVAAQSEVVVLSFALFSCEPLCCTLSRAQQRFLGEAGHPEAPGAAIQFPCIRSRFWRRMLIRAGRHGDPLAMDATEEKGTNA